MNLHVNMSLADRALLSLICIVHLASCNISGVWQKVSSAQCLNESLAVQKQQSDSAIECVGRVRANAADMLVAQFNAVTRQCSVFHYQPVCHLINASSISAHHTQHSCSVYANANTSEIMKSEKPLTKQLNPKFRGVWLMSDNADDSKRNLVACGQTQQWQAAGVSWTTDGAAFNGSSSQMTLENVTFGNLSLGFTWLLRVKRQPIAFTSFLENYGCSGCIKGFRFMEHYYVNSLFFGTTQQFQPTKKVRKLNALPSNQNQFINIGITALPVSNSYTLFADRNFILSPEMDEVDTSGNPALEYSCFRLGSSCGTSFFMTGTVKAVAMADQVMTEAEINEFFDLI